MIVNASYGKVIMPQSEGAVVTIEMGRNWGGITNCPTSWIAQTCKAKALQQHPELDWDKFSFFGYFIPKSPSGGCMCDTSMKLYCSTNQICSSINMR